MTCRKNVFIILSNRIPHMTQAVKMKHLYYKLELLPQIGQTEAAMKKKKNKRRETKTKTKRTKNLPKVLKKMLTLFWQQTR